MKPKQTEITLIPKSNGRSAGGECVCTCLLHWHTAEEIRALGSIWKLRVKRKAEGDCCSPLRCVTHICYQQHGTQRNTHSNTSQASLFSLIFSESQWGTVGCSRGEVKTISRITTLVANLSQDRAATIQLSLSATAISLCVCVCVCVCQRSWEPLILPVHTEHVQTLQSIQTIK